MKIEDIEKVDKNLYDFAAGAYCGVLVDTDTMQKLVKLQSKYQSDVRKILNENIDSIYESNWTLANEMDGDKIKRQIEIKYIKKYDDKNEERANKNRRIQIFKVQQPIYCSEVFMVENHEQAQEIANIKLNGDI